MIRELSRPLVERSLKLALPVAGAYLVIVLGLVAEFVIVGSVLGGSGIAAVGLAGTFSLVLVLSFHALEIAAQAIIARRHGEGNFSAAGACLDNALLLSFLIGVPLTVGLYFLGPIIFQTAESQHVTNLAIDYFNWRLLGIPFVIAILTIIGFFNAISRPTIPMAIYGIVLFLNAFICWGLVGGRLFFPRIGIAGAGIAQSVSVFVGFLIFLAVLRSRRIRSRYQYFQYFKNFNWPVNRGLLRLAGPVFVQQFFGNFGMFLFMLINSAVPDGGISLSAATIARHVGYLTYLPSLGFGIAAATMVGQHLGAGKPDSAAQSGYVCWAIGTLFMLIGATCYIVFREPIVSLFLMASEQKINVQTGADDLTRVAETAVMLLVIVALIQPLEGVNTIVGKALQGAGDTFFVMVASVFCQWGVFLPLAWFLALPMEMGAFGALYASAFQLSLIALMFMIKFRGGGWKKKEV